MAEGLFVGRHEVRVEGDIIRVCHDGEVSLPELQRILAIVRRAATEQGATYLLVDVGKLPPPSAELRRWMSEPTNRPPVEAIAMFGAPNAFRIIMSIFRRGMDLLGKPMQIPFQMCQNEQDARAWLARKRARHSPKNGD